MNTTIKIIGFFSIYLLQLLHPTHKIQCRLNTTVSANPADTLHTIYLTYFPSDKGKKKKKIKKDHGTT